MISVKESIALLVGLGAIDRFDYRYAPRMFSSPKDFATELDMGNFADSTLRVLIVDDNTDTAESLACLLESCGHRTRVAHSGARAIFEAGAFRPDAILLDVGLPDMDGFEVGRQIRANPELRQTILIAATGYNRERDRTRAAAIGFDHYLVKPFDPMRLDSLLTPRAAAACA